MPINLFNQVKKIVSQNQSPQPRYLLALVLGKGTVEAALWYLSSLGVEIISCTQKMLPGTDELSEYVAQAIDEVETKAGLQASDAIFGLPVSWFVQDKIIDSKLNQLQQLSSQLDLVPVAYVSQERAVIHLVKIQERVPPSAVFIGWEDDELTVSVVRIGRAEFGQAVGVQGNWEDAVKHVLTSLPMGQSLPSRIFLWGNKWSGGDLQKLMSSPFLSQLPFLHFPRVELLPQDSVIKAIALAGGVDQARELGLGRMPLAVNLQKTTWQRPEAGQSKVNLDDRFGFVFGKDIAQKERGMTAQEKEQTPAEAPIKPLLVKPQEAVPRPDKLLNRTMEIGTGTSGVSMDGWRFPFLPKWVVILGLALTVVVGGGTAGIFTLAWFIPSAQVTFYTEEQIIEKEAEIAADPQAVSIEWQNQIIPSSVIEVRQQDQLKGKVTGTKVIGDKAKGEVVIYNKTSAQKTLEKGIVLTSAEGLKFLLDTEVTIASQSATVNPQTEQTVTTPGNATAMVVARDIGSDYNLSASPDKSNFTIQGFVTDQMTARNLQAFSGGSSRQVQVVTENDQKKLFELLSGQLTTKVKDQVLTRVPSDRTVLEQAIHQEVVKKSFDRQVGEEARELTLTLEVVARATVYSESDLKNVLLGYAKTVIPENYQLLDQSIQTSATVKKLEQNGKLYIVGRIKASLLPVLPVEQIRDQLHGLPIDRTEQYLSAVPSTIGFEVQLTPSWIRSLPQPLQTMPRNPQKIEIRVVAKTPP